MFFPARLIASNIAIVLFFAASAWTQSRSTDPGGSTLQQHLNAAQHHQQAGDLQQADLEYRAFLAEALSTLATGHARAGNYSRAASFFDEALSLNPDAPQLRLEYARTALHSGDVAHAQTLANAFLRGSPGDKQQAALAHQILGRALLKMNRDRDARKELEQAVALDPSFENGYDLAVVCLDLDDEKCATQLFGEMEASFGDTAALHMHFGEAYGNSDFQPRAIEEFKKVIAEDPHMSGAHYSLAAALLTTGEDDVRVAEAERELKKELEISPQDFLSYAALGKIAITRHRYDEAEQYLKRAISIQAGNPDAFLYLGQMYFDNNRFGEAETALRSAIDLTTDASRNHYQIQKAHFLLGRILMQENQPEKAHAEMQSAHALSNMALSQDKNKLTGLLGDNSAAKAFADQAAPSTTVQHQADPTVLRDLDTFEKQLTPAIADSYNNLGAAAASGAEYALALKYFERAAEWNPSLEGLDYNWGRAAFMASQFADAVPPLSRYVHSHPEDSGSHAALAMSQFMTGNFIGCLGALQGVDTATAAVPQMQYIFAESLVKTGQVSSGKERLEALAKGHPEIAEAHRSLGEVFAAQGLRQKAIDELGAAIQLNANDAEAHYLLGKVKLDGGNGGEAIPEFESAIRLQPSEPRFHRELAAAYKSVSRAVDAEKELRILNTLETSQAHPVGSASPETRSPEK